MPYARFVMSRVYRALERAEEERRKKAKGEPSPNIFEEKPFLSREEPTLKLPKMETEGLGLPPREEASILIVRPETFAAEEFRKLKTQIFLRLANPPHFILVASTVPQEGKTMVSVNLALAISQEIHKKVILIDGDLRKPSIHLEEYPNPKGLSDYLLNQTPLSEILLNSEAESLQIIPAGHPTKKSAELIGSRKMLELFKSLRELRDDTYVIIDSSPIISTSEATLLSKLVDGIILVVMGGRTPRESVRRALKSIDRQKIIGIVFNQIDFNPSSYYYSKYYHYYRYDKKQDSSRDPWYKKLLHKKVKS
jgi:capsular exopolysaccharide synthesis family protein